MEDNINLIPGNEGRDCPARGETCDECDECDYLICCTNANGLCDKCLEEHGACQTKARRLL